MIVKEEYHYAKRNRQRTHYFDKRLSGNLGEILLLGLQYTHIYLTCLQVLKQIGNEY